MIGHPDSFPVSEEMLERVRSGKPLRDVGRIDFRGAPDDLSATDLAAARQRHRATHRYGHEAPIKLREAQVKALVRETGRDPDDKDNPIDCAASGSRFMGHELWVDPDQPKLPSDESSQTTARPSPDPPHRRD